MKINTGALQPDCFYNIYNRGINRESLFKEPRNYVYFLRQWAKFIDPVADTYAYCLLSNHFHVLIRTKAAEDILGSFSKVGDPSRIADLRKPEWHISNQFAIFFRSYALSINKAYDRTGGLFEEPFRRALVETDDHLTRLIAYIHRNPQKHGLVTDFSKYKYSSYKSLLSNLPTRLKREEVIQWFGSKENFIAYHLENIGEADPDLWHN